MLRLRFASIPIRSSDISIALDIAPERPLTSHVTPLGHWVGHSLALGLQALRNELVGCTNVAQDAF